VKTDGSASLRDLFDRYAGADHVIDYRELHLVLNHAFSQGALRDDTKQCVELGTDLSLSQF